jgi:hypothetical protein
VTGFFQSLGSCCPPRERESVRARERKRARALAIVSMTERWLLVHWQVSIDLRGCVAFFST